jgi:serine/threonine protein phosphatase PrpC
MIAWIHAEDRSRGRRPSQQDNYGIFELPVTLASGDLLLVIADGMGGARAGERASRVAVRSFIDAYATLTEQGIPQRLRRALDYANHAVAMEITRDQQRLAGMGCTLLAVVFADSELYWISVGDSLLWVWREGQLKRLNQDHSYRQILAQCVAAGEISTEEASLHPERNALLSALTGGYLTLVDVCERPYSLERGDKVLLASDGLLTLSEVEIAALLGNRVSPELLCQRLLLAVAAANDPDQDNTAVIIAHRKTGIGDYLNVWRNLLTGFALALVGFAAEWLYYRGKSP